MAFPDFAGAPITNDALPHIRAACSQRRTQVTFAADAAGLLTAHGHDTSLRRIEHEGIAVDHRRHRDVP